MGGAIPPASPSIWPSTFSSCSDSLNDSVLGTLFSGDRPPLHEASKNKVILPLVSACSRLGGKMIISSSASPDEERLSPSAAFADAVGGARRVSGSEITAGCKQ